MRRAFNKVSEQNQAPDYLLKRFAATDETIDTDPYEGLRQRANDNRQRIAHDELVYGKAQSAKPVNEWEVERSAETYRNPQMNRLARNAAPNDFSAGPEDLSGRSVRRVDSGQQYQSDYRPMDHLTSHTDVYVTRMDAALMMQTGQSFFDPNLAQITSQIAENDMNKYAQQQMREKQTAVGSKWEAGQKGRCQREHKRVLNRWSNFDAVNGGFTRIGNEREAAGRFGMADPTEAMRRDMIRQEEVEARMQRKAAIKGIDHDTPAQRDKDEYPTMAPTLQSSHTMPWMNDFFRGK